MEKVRIARGLILVGIIFSVFSIGNGGFISAFFLHSIFQSSPFLGFVDMGAFLSFIPWVYGISQFRIRGAFALQCIEAAHIKPEDFFCEPLISLRNYNSRSFWVDLFCNSLHNRRPE